MTHHSQHGTGGADMGSTVIKMKGRHDAGIGDLADLIRREIGADLISESRKEYCDGAVILLCFEKFYFRTGSYASLTVMLTEDNVQQTADIIGFGGGSGLLNFSYGSNSDFARSAQKILSAHGFQ